MPDWSIKIIPTRNKPGVKAEFLPDLSTADPKHPPPLSVEQGDLVSWNNTTGDAHWPWLVADKNAPPTDQPFKNNYLTTSAVQPHSSSDDYYVDFPAGTTLYYCCKLHPAMRGSIVVVPFGQDTDAQTS
jgi:hypothetical protein